MNRVTNDVVWLLSTCLTCSIQYDWSEVSAALATIAKSRALFLFRSIVTIFLVIICLFNDGLNGLMAVTECQYILYLIKHLWMHVGLLLPIAMCYVNKSSTHYMKWQKWCNQIVPCIRWEITGWPTVMLVDRRDDIAKWSLI